MKIISSEFITSVAHKNNLIHDGLPQIAFVGRSNVGKSSLLNMLTGRTKLAKTSSTPGRTRLVNYFLINNSFYFVDLPGYGYAKASKSMVTEWQGLLEPYLVHNPSLKCVCVLVDVRHKPTEQDMMMIEFLSYYTIPFIIIATKCDKLSKAQLNNHLLQVANTLKVGKANIYPTSSNTAYGRDSLLQQLNSMLF